MTIPLEDLKQRLLADAEVRSHYASAMCDFPEEGGGFLVPAGPETRAQRARHALHCYWLRMKWWWRRNVWPLR